MLLHSGKGGSGAIVLKSGASTGGKAGAMTLSIGSGTSAAGGLASLTAGSSSGTTGGAVTIAAGSSTSDEVVWLYRCRFCGLLNTSVKAVFDHMRQLHNEPKHSWTTSRSQWEAMCAPEKVLRRRQPCKTFLPSAMHPGPEPFAKKAGPSSTS